VTAHGPGPAPDTILPIPVARSVRGRRFTGCPLPCLECAEGAGVGADFMAEHDKSTRGPGRAA
jgi:hypothetical protein